MWLKSCGAGMHDETAIHIKTPENVYGLRKYMLKTIHPAFASLYKIRTVEKGVVTGKRCGISKTLGPTARERHRLLRHQKYHSAGQGNATAAPR